MWKPTSLSIKSKHINCDSMELFSRKRWRLVSAQLPNKFGYCPLYTVSIVLWVHKHDILPLGQIQVFISHKLLPSPSIQSTSSCSFCSFKTRENAHPHFSAFPVLSSGPPLPLDDFDEIDVLPIEDESEILNEKDFSTLSRELPKRLVSTQETMS